MMICWLARSVVTFRGQQCLGERDRPLQMTEAVMSVTIVPGAVTIAEALTLRTRISGCRAEARSRAVVSTRS